MQYNQMVFFVSAFLYKYEKSDKWIPKIFHFNCNFPKLNKYIHFLKIQL